jgi:hypothetical protein
LYFIVKITVKPAEAKVFHPAGDHHGENLHELGIPLVERGCTGGVEKDDQARDGIGNDKGRSQQGFHSQFHQSGMCKYIVIVVVNDYGFVLLHPQADQKLRGQRLALQCLFG